MELEENLSQTINFLGFLRGQLSGYEGIPSLCYELIQNADDVRDEQGKPGASKIIFDVCDDALYVYNDGVFRERDFERMRSLSWGNKREEEGTIGSFGLGFVSVYQITDSPEIFSSGRHWKFFPNEKEDSRIRQVAMETKETKFRLPWAFENSEVRKELGKIPIQKAELPRYLDEMNNAIESAALFLKQITKLELKRNGESIRKIEVLRDGNHLLLADGKKTISWKVYEGNFQSDADDLRRASYNAIEKKKRSDVKIAIPDVPNINGLLYAYLPSEMVTGMPFHVNADFYPSSDRKRIIFGEDLKARWNRLAISCASKVLADHCEEILEIFKDNNEGFWKFVERVYQASREDIISPEFSEFWEQLKPKIQNRKSVLTSTGELVHPGQAVFLDPKEISDAEKILEDIGLNLVHSRLRSWWNRLRETGVRTLKLDDIHNAFVKKGFEGRDISFKGLPKSLQTLDDWKILWNAIDTLWNRASQMEKLEIKEKLEDISLAYASDENFWPPSWLYATDKETRMFFSSLNTIIWYEEVCDEYSFFEGLFMEFTFDDGLDLLDQSINTIRQLWATREFKPMELLQWFERNKGKLDSAILDKARALPLWPSADGELRPLSELFIAGDFEDPLKLAKLIDLEEVAGGRDFLERSMKLKKLDYVTYVRDSVPLVIEQRELKKSEIWALVKILAENIGKLRDYRDIRSSLGRLPIVLCENGEFNTARNVWFDTEVVREVLGNEIKFAKLPAEGAEAIREFYEWIGVSEKPLPEDIVNRIEGLVKEVPNKVTVNTIEALVRFIGSNWYVWNDDEKDPLSRLRNRPWLPVRRDPLNWYYPKNVNSIYSSYLFESQGNFLLFERETERASNVNEFFKYLGITSEPTPEQVVKHLLYSMKHDRGITDEIYVFLDRKFEDPSISMLKGKKCLFLGTSDGQRKYLSPDQVFWEEHPFGKYRYRLPVEYGKFKRLFDSIGVKERPDVSDAISVLLEISEEFGGNNVSLKENSDEESILLNCWRMISVAIEKEEINKEEIERKLKGQKTIPDPRKILIVPELMFFEDKPEWTRKFQLVQNNVTPKIEGVWEGMAAAGVRNLSDVIETDLVECRNQVDDQDLLQKVIDRRELFTRIKEAKKETAPQETDFEKIERINYIKSNQIGVAYTFWGFGQRERSDVELVDAILIKDNLFFTVVDGNYPWLDIGRELSSLIDPSGKLRLGFEIKEILSQSIDEANSVLNKLEYPIIETREEIIVESQTLVPGSEEPDLESLPVDMAFPDSESEEKVFSEQDREAVKESGKSQGWDGWEVPARRVRGIEDLPERRKKSRLVSYVYPEDEFSTKVENPDVTEKRTRVGNLGVERVMQYERENGRIPKDMETERVNHPGYDIESISEDESIRYIEVKSLSGAWDSSNPAMVTKYEFGMAKRKAENYWLYVVEFVESESFRIHMINNPAERIDYYLFDHGWIGK